MADDPPEPDSLKDIESALLISLWDRLERVDALATSNGAIAHLPEILRLCEEAAGLIRDGLARPG